MEASIVFPHQLYYPNPAIKSDRKVYLIEDHLYFTQLKFHKKKIWLHRASMKYYESYLNQKEYTTKYIDAHSHTSLNHFFEKILDKRVNVIHYVKTTDFLLEKRLRISARKYSIDLIAYDSPGFLSTPVDLKEMLPDRKYFMASFYKKQRIKHDILINNGEPQGGKWSYDEENRKKLPKDISIPEPYQPQENHYAQEAKEYVKKHFDQNYGSLEGVSYAITHYQAEQSLIDFLDNRMQLFGDYEDAISKNDHFLFHSVLTPALNIGLITPKKAIETLFKKHEEHNYPLNCLEGFVRQIIGWREFMRGIYAFEGVFERTNNHFNHNRRIPQSFWGATTGIEPIDNTINKVLQTGYCHHIERLMILGNFMLLCEFDPDDIYSWFMSLFIDAYDWVMVPNVYGMTQYADGGLITTKPYISSSNYVLKMSNYKKGKWCEIWDGLYWRFLNTHQNEFRKNHRMSFVVKMLEKMDKKTLHQHINIAEEFLNNL
ncbi:cryptochrome/photolyase family protein [Fulvivirga sediminis]|uniref:Cryptochrome/photolyase family protein n=1 Tax=Fulvivirga sediminis TaxID=2803949 RepID=A0A937F2T1_9BACT|nr:cryptochrome/photolyase family protein [Fulvivirga sediminis]MBL3654680.1 cryptochrome/photolyase family protein [Fulvivirga sediminis]